PMLQISGPGEWAWVWRATASSDSSGRVYLRKDHWFDPVYASRSAAGYEILRRSDEHVAEARVEARQYTIGNTGFLGRFHALFTGPFPSWLPDDRPMRFLAFGDSGNGSNTQRAVAETMIAAKPDLIIHLGDLIYPNGSAEDFRRNFFDPYRELLARVPFMPSLGNHDVATNKGQPFLDVFVLPENGPKGIQPERNYWFDFGDARFVALD